MIALLLHHRRTIRNECEMCVVKCSVERSVRDIATSDDQPVSAREIRASSPAIPTGMLMLPEDVRVTRGNKATFTSISGIQTCTAFSLW
jgi:hypothetical protein